MQKLTLRSFFPHHMKGEYGIITEPIMMVLGDLCITLIGMEHFGT